MQKVVTSGLPRRRRYWASFTLIELLTVIAIIAILAALTLAAATGLMNTAARKRAQAEIQAMSAGLENYKIDNGVYPTGSSGNSTASSSMATNQYGTFDPSTAGSVYQSTSQVLFYSLTGKTNFTDTPVSGVKSYMTFKKGQVGTGTGGSYVQDPWSYSYGYSTGTTNTAPNNGTGFFDLWSTGGTTGGATGSETNINTWITNWK